MACAVTEMTPTQLAGALNTKSPSLPVGATTTMLLATAKLMIPCSVDGHVSPRTPPKFRLMICGRFATGFGVTPVTGSPIDHLIASKISDMEPPHLPSARTGRMRTPPKPMPATDPTVAASVLLAVAAMIPAVNEPCQLLGVDVVVWLGRHRTRRERAPCPPRSPGCPDRMDHYRGRDRRRYFRRSPPAARGSGIR